VSRRCDDHAFKHSSGERGGSAAAPGGRPVAKPRPDAQQEVAGHRREATMSGVEDNGHDSGHGEADAIVSCEARLQKIPLQKFTSASGVSKNRHKSELVIFSIILQIVAFSL